MNALDDVIHYHADNCQSGSECDLSALSRAELAQLRVAASEAQAAHVYLDESPVNDPNDPPLELAERAARLVDEILQLRADLQAAQERSAWLTTDIGEDGFAAINRLIAACERGDIAQQAAPDLSIVRDEILRQARQLDEARNLIIRSGRVINNLKRPDSVYDLTSDLLDWLAANPAMHAAMQRREQ